MVSQTENSGTILAQTREAVRNVRRRYVLYYLHQESGAATVDELVERIAVWENGAATDDVSGRKLESVYSSLYQTHLPKLEGIGLVRYDATDKMVSLTEVGERVSLQCAANGRPTRMTGMLFLGLNGLLLVLLLSMGSGFVANDLAVGLGVALVVCLTLVAVWQVHADRSWKRRYWQLGPDYIVEINEEQ